MKNQSVWSIKAAAFGVVVCCFVLTPAIAQDSANRTTKKEVSKPLSGPTPRFADGRPDLGNGKGAWFPEVVDDIAGTGGGDPGDIETQIKHRKAGYGLGGPRMVEKEIDVPFQPWAKKVYDQREKSLSKDDPEARCLPPGFPRMMATPFPFQIYQLADRLIFVFEGGAHVWRIVYMDGRAHSQEALDYPTYLGESIGHWDGDSLVVDIIGFNDKTWLDAAGHPHTEKLHVIERYTRTDVNTLHYEATIDDPGAYTKPWTTSWNISWSPGITPLEYICQEGNLDVQHLIGNVTPDERTTGKTNK